MTPIEAVKLLREPSKLEETYDKLKKKNIPNLVIQYRFLGCSECRDWTKHEVVSTDEFRISVCERCGKEFKEIKVYGEWICLTDLMQFLKR